MRNTILLLRNYISILMYMIIIFYIIGLSILFILFFKKEISELLFFFNFVSINLFILVILFLKLPQFDSRKEFLHLIHSLNIQEKKIIGIEIGVLNGDYSEKIFKFFKTKFDFHLYLIDPWKNYNEFEDYNQKHLDKCFSNVKKKFDKNKNVTILRKTSLEALNDFENESLNFIYIDGNHDYKYILNDLETWFPKLKSHGVLFGDDYARSYGVHKAVNEFSFKHNLCVKFSDNYKQFCFIKN